MSVSLPAWLVAASLLAACGRSETAEFELRPGFRISVSCDEAEYVSDILTMTAARSYVDRIKEDTASSRQFAVNAARTSSDDPSIFAAARDYVCAYGEPPARAPRFPEPGASVPEFRVINHALVPPDTVTRNHLLGRPYLLLFWGSWCLPCREEFPVLRKEYARYVEHGIPFIVVTHNEPVGSANRWVREQGETTLAIHEDPSNEASRAFQVNGIPWMFVVDARGRVISSCAGCRLDRMHSDSLFSVIAALVP